MSFWRSIGYLLCISIAVFILGRLYPRKWLRTDAFPFKSSKLEKNGTIYNKIKIMKWKTKLPDASLIITKILPRFMPKKRLENENNIPV